MNICLLGDTKAIHLRRWARYFVSEGHRVDVITWNPDVMSGYIDVNVHVIRKPLRPSGFVARVLNFPRVYARVRQLLREICPHVVHAHSVGSYAWLAGFVRFHPFVITPWGTDLLLDAKTSRFQRFMTQMCMKHADVITCGAKHICQEVVHLGIPSDRIRNIGYAVDVDMFHPATRNFDLRVRYGLHPSFPLVISTRTLAPIHDVETFLKAIPLIQRSRRDVQFAILGDGSKRSALERLACELSLANVVRFIGFVEEDEMVRWLQTADVYVSTSLLDADLASSTAEAMACGLPVVTADNGSNREWVREGRGGYLFRNGDVQGLAACVKRLLRDESMRVQFGRTNRSLVVRRKNFASEMMRMEEIYRELVARGA